MRDWYRELIRLRRNTPALHDSEPGHTRVTCDEEGRWLSMKRGPINVVCNFAAAARSFDVGQHAIVHLSSRPLSTVMDGILSLGPETVAIVERLDRAPANTPSRERRLDDRNSNMVAASPE